MRMDTAYLLIAAFVAAEAAQDAAYDADVCPEVKDRLTAHAHALYQVVIARARAVLAQPTTLPDHFFIIVTLLAAADEHAAARAANVCPQAKRRLIAHGIGSHVKAMEQARALVVEVA